MLLPIALECHDNEKTLVGTQALLDSGAGGIFIDSKWAQDLGLRLQPLEPPIRVFNVDGTLNKTGTITHYTDAVMKIAGEKSSIRFLATGLGKQRIILGFPWLRDKNPNVDWQKGTLQWRHSPNKAFTKAFIQALTPIETYVEDINDDSLVISYLQGELTSDAQKIWMNSTMTFSQTFAKEEHAKKIGKTIEEMVPKVYHEFLSVFSDEAASRFPPSRPWDHKIILKEGFVPKSAPIYSLPADEEEAVKVFIKENLAKGYIRKVEPGSCEQASAFFFVPKTNGKRPCQDYRYLNEWTVKDSYPLPLISDLMDKLKGKKYFTKMDIRWGYNNVRIRDGDQKHAAFKCKEGLFEPMVMFFGLTNSPATFQRMMDNIFLVQTEQGWLIIYMDDLLIAADTLEELEQYTKIVLKILRDNDLYLKPEKCEFAQIRVTYLGFIIERNKISMDPAKVKGIADWPIPKTVKQVRSFLGFCNFYHKFIKKYSDQCQPLNELLQKDTLWEWTADRNTAFNRLKLEFCKEPVLMMPDQTRPFQVEADASKYASGAVLTQMDSNGERHPVAFLSKSFNQAERNYQVYDRELLGIVRALQEWRHYVQGSQFKTLVLSDHKNLTYWRSPKKLNRRQARWHLELSEYDIELKHIPGAKMILADTLSRRPDFTPDDDNDNEDITMLPEDLFIKLIDTELLDAITRLQASDSQALEALRLITAQGLPSPSSDISDWKTEANSDGHHVLFYKDRIYIPDNLELKRSIVKKFHDAPTAGHPGIIQTFNDCAKEHYWPGMRTFVRNYIQGCGICQQYKINRRPTKPSLYPIPSTGAAYPFKQISMDFITDLPKGIYRGEEVDGILVVVDQGHSKGVVLTPINKEGITAEKTAQLFLENVWKRFGIPDKVISDRGPQFDSKFTKALYKAIGITQALSTAYHPQTDGATERVNQEIELYLSIYCIGNPKTWIDALPFLEFTHNNRQHADRPSTPFQLMYGKSPSPLPTTFEDIYEPSAKEHLDRLDKLRNEAEAAHELARRRMAVRIKSTYVPFKEGQLVWLEAKNIKLGYNKKISTKREGPFKIIRKLGPVNFVLELPQGWKIHQAFHASLLTPYVENEVHGPNYTRPPPEQLENPEWEVERILKHKKLKDGPQYLVLWKGYPITEATWEREVAFDNSPDILMDYKRRHKLLISDSPVNPDPPEPNPSETPPKKMTRRTRGKRKRTTKAPK